MHLDSTTTLPRARRPRAWKVDPWGLVRGLFLLASSFIVIVLLHCLVLFLSGD